ncbi:hypothetical protein SO3561_10354 [Streptomyces olivochromogenes]|uniref:Uncharacterized protein n=1 Tax=Streptomyces olivochromogenes TaxID=1963 RepID=A0A286PGV0_STROL|nr:hypothetical protein SO3561_10354 [Streptomyces olivochromogenes]
MRNIGGPEVGAAFREPFDHAERNLRDLSHRSVLEADGDAQAGHGTAPGNRWMRLRSNKLVTAIPTVAGGTLALCAVGLTMWVAAPLRCRRRSRSAGG